MQVKDSNKTVKVNNKYFRDVYWVTYLGGVYSGGGGGGGGLIYGGRFNGIEGNFIF